MHIIIYACHDLLIHDVSRLLSDSYPEEVKKIVDCLSANLTGVYDAHRVTVVSFYSEVDVATLHKHTCVCYTYLFLLWLLDTLFIYQSTAHH